MNYEEWLVRAQTYIELKVTPNQAFECKSLFPACEWDRLSRGDKVGFGKFFSNEVQDGRVPGIVKIDRAKNNHCLYRKAE